MDCMRTCCCARSQDRYMQIYAYISTLMGPDVECVAGSNRVQQRLTGQSAPKYRCDALEHHTLAISGDIKRSRVCRVREC